MIKERKNKMSKIIITGGLGYVGTQLCKLYIPETLENEIIVSDRRFLPERVKELKEWGFKYVQSDLLDRDTIKELVQDADIVYHLGGITDVAYVKTESNEGKDKQMLELKVQEILLIIYLIQQKLSFHLLMLYMRDLMKHDLI